MSEKDPKRVQRENVINEIFKTEHVYNMGLQMMNQLVSIPLNKLAQEGKLNINPDIPKFFEKITQIQMISDTLTEQLNFYMQSNDPNKSIGKCFERFPKLIIIYFDFIRDYNLLGPQIIQERETNKAFNDMLTKAESQLGDTISGFLITPVQRPPRYRLLLQELIKTTPEDSQDYILLKKALDKVCEEISKVDEAVEVFEEAVKMSDLQSRFTDFDVFKLRRRLLFNDDALKFSRRWTNNRHIVIFDDVLVVAEQGMLPNSLKVNKIYHTGEYMISPVEEGEIFKNAVELRQKNKSFRMNLPTPKSKTLILEAFDKLLEQSNLDKKELELKGFAPVWIPDDQAPYCMLCKAKFSFINRRHHCRYCGDCICKNCFNNKIPIPGRGSELVQVCPKCYTHILEITKENNNGVKDILYDDNSDDICTM
ncbi:putative Rho guanine nucleotide exchange factor [Histomonas meleagridis]|uniref:putative Rho guanine nucleotide exchange factor n=1 Tax=Histomonas meleagridis TaxID=135588 RepID=UPI00355A8209|nr:putative Rho guanine nucleotide exchange factor [Histomonas meleagridis]KAH0805130.1 putative Rho guanine nucleotide exchange factor [Histomonas meleagridis]